MSIHATQLERVYKKLEEQDNRIIDLDHPVVHLKAHADALWLKLLQGGPDSATIEETRQLLRRALFFLQSSPTERWILQPYKHILSTDSLRGILDELLSWDLVGPERLTPELNPLISRLTGIVTDETRTFRLTEGRIRKRRYIVFLPRTTFFIADPDERLFKEAGEDPLQFVRDHLEDIPKSLLAQELERSVVSVENLQNDRNLEKWTKTVAVGMTANAIAVALSNFLNLPSEARAFITVFVSSLPLLVRRDSS